MVYGGQSVKILDENANDEEAEKLTIIFDIPTGKALREKNMSDPKTGIHRNLPNITDQDVLRTFHDVFQAYVLYAQIELKLVIEKKLEENREE